MKRENVRLVQLWVKNSFKKLGLFIIYSTDGIGKNSLWVIIHSNLGVFVHFLQMTVSVIRKQMIKLNFPDSLFQNIVGKIN